MDYGGAMSSARVQGNFIDLHKSDTQQRNLIIEVVVLDLTHPSKTVYQLKRDTPFTNEELKLIKQGAINIPHDAFILLGEAQTIHKTTKQIILVDQNTVTYNHLITVTGKQPTLLSYEFLDGLYTLIDALRLNKTFPDNFSTLTPQKLAIDMNISVQENHDEKIEKLGNTALPNHKLEQPTILVSELNKKLYQIQI